ncbi:MAG: hypothetical protein M0T74_17260, partial [Desulfitobacterium hafniense]|nr:hypothetical protein [Desulfitobacterium hafniense]
SDLVAYADRRELEREIIKRHVASVEVDEEMETAAPPAQGGMVYTPAAEPEVIPRAKAPVRVE